MSNHTEENNLDPLAQLFIKPLISEVAVNEEEKEEVSAIEALLGPDVKKVEPGTKKEISRIDIPATTVSEVSVVPDEVVEEKIDPVKIKKFIEKTPKLFIPSFASQVISPNYNDLSEEQRLTLDDYAVDLIEKNYGEGEDYTIEPAEIALKVNSIWQNQILPNVSFDRLNATELEKFTQQYVPIFNPVSDFIGDMIRYRKTGSAQSDVVDPVFELIKKGGEVTEEDLQGYIDAVEKTHSLMQTDEMRSFSKIYEENDNSVIGFLKGIWENPTILPGLLVSSLSTQIGSLQSEEVRGTAALSAGVGAAGGAAAGLTTGPLAPVSSTAGALTGTMVGFITGATATMEAALTFSELLHEEIGEPLTKENIKALLEDEERYNDLIKKAIARGVTIGTIEGITGGLAKGVTSKVVKLGFGDRAAAATGLAIEGFGGGLGETGGRIAADQEMDVAEIGFEGIIPGTTTGVITVFPELNVVKNSWTNLNNTVNNAVINRELKGTNFINIESVFEPTTDVSDAAVNLSQSSRAKNYLNKNLDQKILSGDITQEQAVEVKTRYRDIEGAVRKLNKIDVANNEAVQLLIEKNKLENTIKDVNDNSLTINEKARVEVINNRLSEITQTSIEEKEATVGMGVVPGKRTTPRADQLALEYKENPAEANIEALLDQYNRIGLAAIKFDTRKGDIAREDAVAEINKEFAGIMERWSPDQGAFSTFVTANIAPKAQSIYDKYIGKRDVTTLDRQEAREVVAEEVDVEIEPVDTSRPKVYPATLEVITENITPEVRSEQTTMIKDDINRAVATVSTSPKVVAKNLVDQTQTKEYRQLIKNKLGKWNSEQYNNNVDRLVTKDFIATIPIAQIKRRFGKLFNIQQTGTTPTTKIEDGKRTDFRKQVYKIPAITDAQLEAVKDYFKANEKRQQSLYSLLGEGIAIEQMQELRGDQQFMTDLQGRLELKGSNLTAEQFINEVEYNLDKRNLEDTSLDVVENTVEDVINNRITEENINDIEVDALSKAISQLETFRKTNLSMNALTGIVEAGLRTLKAGIEAGTPFVSAIKDFVKKIKDFIKKPTVKKPTLKKPKVKKSTSKKSIDTKRMQAIGKQSVRSPRAIVEEVGGKMLPNDKSKWTDKDFKIRNDNTILNLPVLGTAFFNTASWSDSSRSIFDYSKKNNVNEFQDLLNAPVSADFITENQKFFDEAVKDGWIIPKGDMFFINKNKLPKYGSVFTENQISVIKKAETEQASYMSLPKDKRASKLKNSDFIELQNNKDKILKKLSLYIQKDVWSDGSINTDKLNFWASWLSTQASISKHPVRILAPIKFFSTSNTPVRSVITYIDDFTGKSLPVLKVNNKGETVRATKLNYVAEHAFQSSITVKTILDLVINKSVNQEWNVIKDNFIQGQLLTTDDVIVNKNYKTKLPQTFWDMKNPNIWVRYLLGNPDINLNDYITLDSKNNIVTIAEYLGVPLDINERNADNIAFQNELILEILTSDKTATDANAEVRAVKETNAKQSKQIKKNKQTLLDLIDDDGTTESSIKVMSNADKAATQGRKIDKPTKGISVFDFDDTLAFSNSKVIVNKSDGTTEKITPAEFALQAETLEDNGAQFDFSEFNKVIKGKKGPLADIALKRQNKFGSGDIFILTARPQASARSIQKFLKGIGLDIPLNNITGLENGSPQAKALWILDKAAKGYNDFYFADDSLANVQAVKNILDQIDVKSKVQQVKKNKVKNLDKEFNVIIEQQSGKKWYKTYSKARAKTTGRKVGTFEFFIPPSAEDFSGLLYKILPKGEKGNLAKKWFKDNLFDPFNEAEQQIISSKISVANDFQALRKNIDNVPKNLNKPVGVGNFTHSQALRVYIWNMQGMEIPGLSTRDLNRLVDKIENNADLKVFAEKIAFIQKGKSYPKPGDNWVAGNITSDIIQNLNKAGRKEALQNWQQNVDIIFSDKNLNKLEALYGSNFILALKNSLGRMKSGSNRPIGMNPQVNNLLDWLNNSVGAVMFLNMRSATLQLISSVNFLNWSDNNPVAAAKAFANQKQYWSDVMTLLNSDYLVQRRNGLKINVAESEIAEAARKGGMKGAIAYLLNKGFVLTRFADSMAIATGGASFYRNRVNALLKQVNIDTGDVYTKAEAETKAFDDFYQISEESQQSSRTDRISMQQASSIGRLILNFANTPMQYARIMKKSALDLANGRGDWKTNLSKIAYYGFVQNLIFNAMQQAVFALAFGSDDEEERTAEDRAGNIANGMVDSILRGLGYGGAAVATVKDVIIKLTQQGAKKNPKYEDAVSEVFNFSPAIDSKVRKLRSAAKTFSWNRKEIKSRGFNLDNPAYLSIAQIISATTNIPLDRAARIMMNLKQAVDKDTEIWQRVALMFGYSGWELGLPYWGLQTTIDKEEEEKENIKTKYKNEASKLKTKGYKRIPMTKGKPDGKLNVDFIQVARPTGDLEYWLMPKK